MSRAVAVPARITGNWIGYDRLVSPLFLVNWHSVHVRFRNLMWMLVVALTVVILFEAAPPTRKPAHQPPRGIPVLAPTARHAQAVSKP